MAEASGDPGRATRILEDATFVDMCWTTNPALPMSMFDGKSSLDRALEAGLSAAGNTLTGERDNFRRALEEMNRLYLLVQARPDKLILVRDASDIHRAKREHKHGSIILFQTGSPIEDDWPNTLPVLYRLGLRMMQLTYNEQNLLGAGCHEPHDGGLTAYGKQVVKALNALGIIIDLSHVGRQTALEAVRLSKSPVVFSHTNAAALCDHPRNMTDEAIEAVRENGGVIGAAAYAPLCANKGSSSAPGMDDYLDQIDYLVQAAGPDHVGIGTDLNENITVLPTPAPFQLQYGPILGSGKHELALGLSSGDGRESRIQGFERIEYIGNVVEAMITRGYSDDLITKILGGNFLRLAEQVW